MVESNNVTPGDSMDAADYNRLRNDILTGHRHTGLSSDGRVLPPDGISPQGAGSGLDGSKLDDRDAAEYVLVLRDEHRNRPKDFVEGTIIFDSASSSKVTGSTFSWTHTIGTGGSRLLVVGVSISDGTLVNTVTYGDVEMLWARRYAIGSSGSCNLFFLANPPEGSALVEVTLAGSANIVAGAASWFGVDQADPVGTSYFKSDDSGTDTEAIIDLSSRRGEMLIGVLVADNVTATVETGMVSHWNDVQTDTRGCGASVQGDAMVTMGWTFSSGSSWAIMVSPIKPSHVRSGRPGRIFLPTDIPVVAFDSQEEGTYYWHYMPTDPSLVTYMSEPCLVDYSREGGENINKHGLQLRVSTIGDGKVFMFPWDTPLLSMNAGDDSNKEQFSLAALTMTEQTSISVASAPIIIRGHMRGSTGADWYTPGYRPGGQVFFYGLVDNLSEPRNSIAFVTRTSEWGRHESSKVWRTWTIKDGRRAETLTKFGTNWRFLEIVVDGKDQVSFYLDGTLVAVHTDTRTIPISNMFWAAAVQSRWGEGHTWYFSSFQFIANKV